MTACALQLERSDGSCASSCAPRSTFAGAEDLALHAVDGRPRFGQRVDAVTEFESQQSLPLGFARRWTKGARTPGPVPQVT